MEAGGLGDVGMECVSCESRKCEAILGVPHKVYITQSTTVYVPSSDLGLSHPLSRQRVCPSPRYQMGGGHTRLWVRGWGSLKSDDWRKSLALCLPHGVRLPPTTTPLHACNPPPPPPPTATTNYLWCYTLFLYIIPCSWTLVHRTKTDHCDLFYAPPSYPA